MKSTITTIITTFQRPHLLKKAILSVLSQSCPDFLVCVYDNASGDETEEIVRNLMEKDSRIKYHRHSENIGMMANYKFALARVDTPFFSLLSDDDFLLPSFFETALQGFEQFPEIALSACGVQAIDENEQFVSSPLSIWSREGYFAPLEGLEEMIEKPLLPVGILFSSKIINSVEIDCSKEIQIRWDTDYLLQIISQFSYATNKQICAIFLSHSQGYSTGCYRQQRESPEKFSHHLDATERMKRRLMKRLEFHPKLKKSACNVFSRIYERDLLTQIDNNIKLNMFSEIRLVMRTYREFVGIDKHFIWYSSKNWVSENAAWVLPFIRLLLFYARKILGLASRKRNSRTTS